MKNIHFLGYQLTWFGKYIGYENMLRYFTDIKPILTVNKESKYNRAIGKIIKSVNHWENVRSDEALTGWKYKLAASRYDLSHILYLETYLFLFSKPLKQNEKLISTIHLPISRWTKENLARLENLKAAIILYDEDANEFSKYLGSDQLYVLKYGIDTNFYRRDKEAIINKKKILFVGHYLRDFDLLYDVFYLLKKEIGNDFEFHFVIPSQYRKEKVLAALSAEQNVFFYEKLTDEELLRHYQTSYVMLMPMKDSGVNTAIMQALSIGLPIITNEAGGIKSYGGNTVFPIAKSEAASIAELFYRYYKNDVFREETATRQRAFAEAELDWSRVAAQHVSIYNKVRF